MTSPALRLLPMLLAATLTLGGIAACGGEGPTAPSVESLVLAGAPSGALRVGATAQLMVTALSSSGSTINGASIAWKSSNPAVVAVSSSGLVTALAAGEATVTASSGRGNATAGIIVVAPLVLTEGRTVSMPDGSLSLALAPGVRGGATLLVGPGEASLADAMVVPGTIFQIATESGGSGYFTGVTLSIRYDPARLPAGVTAGGLQLYQRTTSGWTPIGRSASDETQRIVTGPLPVTGIFAARYTPIDRLALTGAQVDGALYMGQTTKFGIVALSATNDTLANRTVSWSSSAPAVVTVDGQGTLTAAGTGSATITASSGTVSVATQIQVLPRPVASWTGTLDWTTYRGNNRRTGYVDVTLDPVTFTKKWEVALATTGGDLNAAATGNGNVYVSSNTYYGGQALWALDAVSGATRWTRAFGTIHSVNGPATGNDRVYVSTGGHEDSFLWSFAAADGSVMFRSPYGNQWSRWHAPAVTPDAVFLGGGYYGGISAFGAHDGALLWSRALPQEDSWTPAADAGTVYAFGYDQEWSGGLLSMDATTGNATLVAPNLGLPASGTPVIGSTNEIFGSSTGRLYAIDLAGDVVKWDLPGAYQGVPAVDGTNVYAVGNGQVEARRRTDGGLAWTWVPQPGLSATGSLVVTRNLVFVRLVPPGNYSTSGSRIVAIDLAARRVVWSHDADGEIVLGDGLLIVTGRTGMKVTAIAVR